MSSSVELITALVTHDAAQDDDELRTVLVSNTAVQLEKLLIPDTSIEMY